MTQPAPSARLSFEPMGPAHRPALLEVYGDLAAMRWVGDGTAITEEECDQWLEVTARNLATRGYGMLALRSRATNEVLGFAGLVHPGGQEEPELKYALGRGWWGQGLATEAGAALLAWGRESLGMDRIQATVAEEHAASRRVLAKLGMVPCGREVEEDGSVTLVYASTASPEQPGAGS
jgi:RimJ/RimL family protein N-acetyltransferase